MEKDVNIICIVMLYFVYIWFEVDIYICNVYIYGYMVVICFFLIYDGELVEWDNKYKIFFDNLIICLFI